MILSKEIAAYEKHKHLKLAAEELGIKWQSLYVHLVNAGVKVTGNKSKYGCDADRLAYHAESMFSADVPIAQNNNDDKFQAKCDFTVNGFLVDVKAATLKLSTPKCKVRRWSFSISKQEEIADFFVCYGFLDDEKINAKCFLIPGDICRFMKTVSTSENGGKWDMYEVDRSDLLEFFEGLNKKQ